MSAMDGMHLHHGATASVGSAMGAGTWPGAAASFLGMWVVMTVVMMLPSIAPALWRYRVSLGRAGATRADVLTALAGMAYLVVWTAAGLLVFLLGLAISAAGSRWPALMRIAPIAAGAVVLVAGSVQLTAWKARRLARCRETPAGAAARVTAGRAWSHGLRLGRDCGLSCAGAMASVLALGLMDVRAMTVATVAITAERLAPAGDRIARVIGLGAITAGAVLIVRAAGRW
jgi:predicted metal-binding membrane protein